VEKDNKLNLLDQNVDLSKIVAAECPFHFEVFVVDCE